jgi:hypothetical protein
MSRTSETRMSRIIDKLAEAGGPPLTAFAAIAARDVISCAGD